MDFRPRPRLCFYGSHGERWIPHLCAPDRNRSKHYCPRCFILEKLDFQVERTTKKRAAPQRGAAKPGPIAVQGRGAENTVADAPEQEGRLQRADQRTMLTAMVRVLSERDEAEEALRLSRERFDLAASTTEDGLFDWDLSTNRLDYSPRWKAMLGLTQSDIGDTPDEWFARVYADDRPLLRKTISDHLEGQTARFESEHRILHADGSYRFVRCRGVSIRDEEGQPTRIVGSQTDITSQRQVQRELRNAAIKDPLTGLANRAYFLRRLERACRRAHTRRSEVFAVEVLDLDRFKVVNDSLGHPGGDELLVKVGAVLKTCLRPSDLIGRLGGDEFAVLLEGLTGETQAVRVAEQMQSKLSRPFQVGRQDVFTAASIGIALGHGPRTKPADLLRAAEVAMHRAKALGKGRYELFDQATDRWDEEFVHIETDLHRACEQNEFVIHYQPIAEAADGRICGCEALLRWEHPEKGLLFPGQFMPVAEETGLITDITDWLLRTACSAAVSWQQEGLGEIRVSVNISGRQFQENNLYEAVSKALDVTGLTPQLLQLELTETSLIDNAEAVVEPLVGISNLGVRISLDDFGTGYSSLMHLRSFPIHALKIDECFVRCITNDPDDAAITAGLISLAHGLRLKVVAEGVETPEQLRFLKEHNCDEIQGHIISPALDRDAFADILQQPWSPAGDTQEGSN